MYGLLRMVIFSCGNDLCMECGACVLNCPVNALEVDAGVGCADGCYLYFTSDYCNRDAFLLTKKGKILLIVCSISRILR